ncbi:heterokaryon incompatibility protein-domain-containing protein [Xylaria scruposa]|nr:heterokaryon incompatibility protein-domain-containing protein [Xylaria scruposa]
MTTRDNYKYMEQGFDLEKCPATFRDAIKITRILGIRYLWIDSLCIIQNDIDDWQRESSRMKDVYQNAYLTIAAVSAADDTEGFLGHRPAALASLRVVSPTGETADLYLRKQGQYYSFPTLDTRAWALQERYLSCRQLRFYSNRIAWDCQTCAKDEVYMDTFEFGAADNIENILRGSYSWYDMVLRYTRRNLSYESDKLPALSGLASIVAEHTNFKYCAGIWWENIDYSIYWQVTDERQPNDQPKRPANYIAPSWSWASIIGAVQFPADNLEKWSSLESVAYLDCRINLKGADRYGEVKGGWLRLRAPRLRVDDCKNRLRARDKRYREKLQVTYDFGEETTGELWALFLLRNVERARLGSIYPPDLSFHGLIIRNAHDQSSHRYEEARRETGQNDLYERVGCFWLDSAEPMSWWQPAEEIVII